MISCIVIDDEPLALKQLKNYIEKIPFLELKESFLSALKALDYLQKNTVDLLFVDINMPDISGIDFVKSLTNPPKVIFTTAYREYAVEGFQVDAADYLVKPISLAAFIKSVEKTKSRYFSAADSSGKQIELESDIHNKEGFLFIKSDYKIVRINLNEIKYIEGMRDYIKIHLLGQKPMMILARMSKILEHLPETDFMRVHRSFIVNLTKITTIERNRIVFDNDVYIPISEQYKDDFQQFLDKNFLK